MIQFAGQHAMAASMPGQKHHLASRQLPGQQLIRRRAKGSFDFDPLLLSKAFNMIQAAAADNADARLRHGPLYSIASERREPILPKPVSAGTEARTRRPLCCICNTKVVTPPCALDIVSAAFVKVIRAGPRFPESRTECSCFGRPGRWRLSPGCLRRS